ncbi:MAG: hypothetical protein IT435_03960 [Phycisphaerales bacterium]|nr:hypothetical protein [Phycisphaerales bacterium]
MSRDDAITWAALLAKWTEFAQAALALPKDEQGKRWRAAVPDIIALQAITHALSEIDSLTRPGERALGIDRAQIQIRTHGGNLHRLWGDEPLMPQLAELISDATLAHEAARSAGSEWCVAGDQLIAQHPASLVEPLLAAGFSGDLFVPTPGIPLFRGCPAVFMDASMGEEPAAECLDLVDASDWFDGELAPPERIGGMRQAYRQFDFSRGVAVRDLVLPLRAGLPGGQPLLVCAIEKGKPVPVTLPPRRRAPQPPLPVRFEQGIEPVA